MNVFILCIIFIFFRIFNFGTGLQCIDEHNNSVDWFVVYKLPKFLDEGSNGYSYIYMTSRESDYWRNSFTSINNDNSIISNSLKELYSNSQNILYILYNDEPPYGVSKASKGHNKGVVLANHDSGLWLIHSVPHFPSLQKYSYPETAAKYGQSFMCISLSLQQLEKVGLQLQYNEPQIYAQNVPNFIQRQFPQIKMAASNKTISKAPWFRVTYISSLNNVSFLSFAKSKHFAKELYEDLVAPTLTSDLYVETWADGTGRLPSNCSKSFKVLNIEQIYVKTPSIRFNVTHDHSKWAVSQQPNWLCVGDINRMKSQKVRGGGTVCVENKDLALNYQDLVNLVEDCKY